MQSLHLIGNPKRRVLWLHICFCSSLSPQCIEALYRQHLLSEHVSELPRSLMRNLLKPRHIHALRNFAAPGSSPAYR